MFTSKRATADFCKIGINSLRLNAKDLKLCGMRNSMKRQKLQNYAQISSAKLVCTQEK